MADLPSDPQALLSDPYLLFGVLDDLGATSPPPSSTIQTFLSFPSIPIPATGFVTVAWLAGLVFRLPTGVVISAATGNTLYTPPGEGQVPM